MYWGITRNIIANAWVNYSETNDNVDLFSFRSLWSESLMPSNKKRERKVTIKPVKYKKRKVG